MKNSELLRGSADLLRDKGWCQNSPYGLDGSRCMMGAITGVSNLATTWRESVDALGRVVGDNYPEALAFVPDFAKDQPASAIIMHANDFLMTDISEPIAMFEKAALMEEEGGR